MDLDFTQEQDMLRTSARDFLTTECDKAKVRKLEEDEKGYSPEIWSKMAELGPATVEAFEVFSDEGRVKFIDRPHNKRVNDIVERALWEAILSPLREPDEERKFLGELLEDVRKRAQVFLSD